MHAQTHTYTHACFFSTSISCPLVLCKVLDMTRWKGTPETKRWALWPAICLSLLYFLSPPVPLWPVDPPLQLDLTAMCVLAEPHDCCPPCPMVKKKTFRSPEGVGGGRVARHARWKVQKRKKNQVILLYCVVCS